ncbi:hypothetical protein OS493_019496 [Desmophyllum pertusum]|uniref:Uncharacterized protein n=1 Tax=Desmophyllum pertusum TaxID=174260 RepID=A0A9W9ZRS2_9CNID|nr:hypothetical protein OS493_019496 [Desmophyllum pertusum]
MPPCCLHVSVVFVIFGVFLALFCLCLFCFYFFLNRIMPRSSRSTQKAAHSPGPLADPHTSRLTSTATSASVPSGFTSGFQIPPTMVQAIARAVLQAVVHSFTLYGVCPGRSDCQHSTYKCAYITCTATLDADATVQGSVASVIHSMSVCQEL